MADTKEIMTPDALKGFSVLGDNPIERVEDDCLDFGGFVKPLSERLISSMENTPFTVGILANWGQGKSSVMRMLQLLLEKENCPTVWFEPWKYNSREEVWKGLAYTLLSEIRANDTLIKELKRKTPALKRWLAKALWTRLMGKQGAALVDAVQEEPWSPKLLHEFESMLNSMIDAYYPPENRGGGEEAGAKGSSGEVDLPLVLFVDDLDRCLPATALAVLEAMKLVLNKPGMIIVMGVAEEELSNAVMAAYAKEMDKNKDSIKKDWGARYVEKIFQVPFHVPRLAPDSLNNYVEENLKKSRLWKPLGERSEWNPIIHDACRGNLREIKRLINFFITELDKAAANPMLARSAHDPTHDVPRVFFIQLLARRFKEFYEYILIRNERSWRDRDLLIRYQRHFLDKSNPGSVGFSDDDSKFLVDEELRKFFENCFDFSDGAPLVSPFSDPLEVTQFLLFGMLSTEAEIAETVAEMDKATAPGVKEEGVEEKTASKEEPVKKGEELLKKAEEPPEPSEPPMPPGPPVKPPFEISVEQPPEFPVEFHTEISVEQRPEVSVEQPPSVEKERVIPAWVDDAMSDIQQSMASTNYNEAKSLASHALKRAEKIEDPLLQAEFLSRLSEIHQFTRNYKEASITLIRQYSLYDKLGEKRAAVISAIALTKINRMRGAFDLSIDISEAALVYARELGDIFVLLDALRERGRTLLVVESHSKAKEVFEEMKALSVEREPQKALEADILIAEADLGLGHTETAQSHIEEVLGVARDMGDHDNEANALSLYARFYEKTDNFDAASFNYNEEYTLRQNLGDRLLEMESLWNYLRTKVFAGMDLSEFNSYADQLINLARRIGEFERIAKESEDVAKQQADSGEDEKAKMFRYLAKRLRKDISAP